jgi:type IV pilus assembly protein PilV
LVEVLVSILILTLGILAMASMMAAATRYNKTSELRSVATLLASDFADRMRANPDAFTPTASSYDLTGNYTAITAAEDGTACGDPNNCSTGELAAIDIAQWRTALFFSLPAPDAFVQYHPTQNSVDLWVAWMDPSADSGQPVNDVECPATFRAANPRPRCIYFRIGL